MDPQRLLRGDPSRTSVLYLAIGAISLVKAIALRNDRNRFRRELLDAGLFIGVGLALRRYARVKEDARSELRASVPDWVLGESGSPASELRERAMAQFGREPEPEPTVRERARRVVRQRR